LALAASTALVVPGFAGSDDHSPVPEDAARVLRLMSDAFAAVSSQVKPAVVSITTETEIEHPVVEGFPGLREFFDNRPGGSGGQPFTQRGLGSGVILSADGIILTNNHVVGMADELSVRMWDGRVYQAKLIGADAESDVAVIKVETDDELPYAKLGNSDELRVGEWVIAVGSPFHLEHSVTAGIVSALGRSTRLTQYEDFIQTDAAINPGNSGGPMVNLDGEVVGINTAIATRSGAYQGIGFAIPANMARIIMDDLIREGRVIRGWLGVSIQNIDQDMAETLGLDRPLGALVQAVADGSAAKDAGLEEGDVILKLDGEVLRDVKHLQNRVALTRPGTTVNFTVSRSGSERVFPVTLAERDASQEQIAQLGDAGPEGATPYADPFGLEVSPLTEELAQGLDTRVGEGGLVVQSVSRRSAAEEKGVQPGDIIREVDREPIRDLANYRERVENLEGGEAMLLLVERDGRTRFFALRKP
jgi:serine protease Do